MLDLKNKRVTVAGLGHFGGGIAAARWLVGQGARVLVTDLAPAEKLRDSVAKLEGVEVEYRLGEHRPEDFTQCDLVVASPAIPPESQYLAAARAAGVPVTTEIRLFLERCPLPVIGVSGTKGKSTTTTLLGMMLRKKHRVWQGGNIGKSLLSDLPELNAGAGAGSGAGADAGDLVLLELSSFMLYYLSEMAWSPHVALLTMLSSDHVEWHGTQEAYLDAKKVLLRFQKPGDFAVLDETNEVAKRFAEATAAQVVWYGLHGRKQFELALPGRHNQFNAQAAFAAAGVMGVTFDEAQSAVRDFVGLPHRLEMVHTAGGVKYFNDSIATIPDAASAALESFESGKVIQIVGGHDKGLSFESMCHTLAQNTKATLCIGETAGKIAGILRELHPEFSPFVYECGTLAAAMQQAKAIAEEGDIVLLSTGCSSYDQFSNFQQRGELFAQLARDA